MVRSDLDTILLPLLQMLYASDRRTSSQMYMLLIIVLLLSQDAAFAANVHKCVGSAISLDQNLMPSYRLTLVRELRHVCTCWA